MRIRFGDLATHNGSASDRQSGQIAGAITAGKLGRIAPIGLDAVAGFHGDQGGGDHVAVDAQLGELPVEDVAIGAPLIADPQSSRRAQFANQPGHHVRPIGDHARRPELPGGLGHRHGNRLRMDIEPDMAQFGNHKTGSFACSSAWSHSDRVTYVLRSEPVIPY